jgi:hypothetical protein
MGGRVLMKKKIVGVLVALALVGAVLFQVLPASAAAPGVLHEVQITPKTATVAPGGTVQLVAQSNDDGDAAITGLTFTWTVTTGTGTVSATGLFTATATLGTSTIQVTATQNTITKTATAKVMVTANGLPPVAKLELNRLTKMLGPYMNSVGFDNFLGAQWQVKNGTAIDTIKAIPGVVQTASTTALTIMVNGQTTPTSFTLTADSVILPKGTVLAATDKVVIVTTNDAVTTVIKINALSESENTPPGLRKNGKERSDDKKTPPGWSMGKKNGWNKDNQQVSNNEED